VSEGEARRIAHWEQVYRTKDPTEVSWYQADPAVSFRLIEQTGVGRSEPILDVGGGASLLADRLIAAGYRDVTVLDLSGAALEVVQKRLGPALQVIMADVTRFGPARRYALWHDRAGLHFLTDPDDKVAYVRTLMRALRPGGHVILATFALDGPTRCSGLPVARYDGPRMADLLGPVFRLRGAETETHYTPSGAAQHFQYGWFTFSEEPS
jgi:SAM-dependent methyltransferase